MGLSPDTVAATYTAATGATVGVLSPQGYDRRILTMALVGPAGSAFSLYRGYVIDATQLMVTTGRGQRNTYDAAGSQLLIRAGEAATVVWSGGGAASPGATARVTIITDQGA